ncbi:putative alpha/beta hydrolase family protein DUF2235 [Rhodobacter aestuarii]|uniref:Uncharacterized alpha/beta hydrolase domain n=1 Tax=Rhodobacter aestuarii TaxID=453582 RepID=A0A1N7N7J6_9RHOB|nr:putative alpha/beta hydrolase family protein DUF2235 [Rhodobacter aestuarii]SIS94169.1 Uncharacterized alpha/beta hydrolase domain [Rhodobacter aestuarii]
MVALFQRLVGRTRHEDRAACAPTISPRRPARGPVDHVVLLDGTLGSLNPMRRTSIGILYLYLRGSLPRASLYYGRGLRYRAWRDLKDVWLGWGVEAQIMRAYGWLAMRYRPGDRIFLLGYSRGAFAARSLAGLIDKVGLLKASAATERNVLQAWRHYMAGVGSDAFRERNCHRTTRIEMVGVFDTVAALGPRFPFRTASSAARVDFHDHDLGPSVRHGFQALALHETRQVLAPLMWNREETGAHRIEQVWFRGCHADIGGQLAGEERARPLANIPLVWMMERAEGLGLELPFNWRANFPRDAAAPSVGSWGGWGKTSLLRAPRVVHRCASERIHETALAARREWWLKILPLPKRQPGAAMTRQVAVPRA